MGAVSRKDTSLPRPPQVTLHPATHSALRGIAEHLQKEPVITRPGRKIEAQKPAWPGDESDGMGV